MKYTCSMETVQQNGGFTFFRVNSTLYLSILFDCSLLRADRWGGGVPIQHKSFIVGPNSMERNSFFYHSASIKAVTVHWKLVVHKVRRWLLGNRINLLNTPLDRKRWSNLLLVRMCDLVAPLVLIR